MKIYTQKELIEEGIWKGIKTAVGGAVRGADYLMGQLAPEAQRLYKDPYKAAKGFVSAVKGTPETPTIKAASTPTSSSSSSTKANSQEISNIRKGLSSQNATLLDTPTLSYTDPSTKMKYFNVKIGKNNKSMNAIVDSNGRFATP